MDIFFLVERKEKTKEIKEDKNRLPRQNFSMGQTTSVPGQALDEHEHDGEFVIRLANPQQLLPLCAALNSQDVTIKAVSNNNDRAVLWVERSPAADALVQGEKVAGFQRRSCNDARSFQVVALGLEGCCGRRRCASQHPYMSLVGFEWTPCFSSNHRFMGNPSGIPMKR